MSVQLGPRERIKVYIELDTDRILGFTPEFAKPMYPAGIRYKDYTLLHAAEIERYVKRYREQQERDAYEATLLRIKREERFRKALAAAIRQRNEQVNPFNRDLNNTLIRLMDERYNQIVTAMLHPQVYGMNEAYEATTTAHEFALDSPYFKHGPERIAEGEAVESK